MKKIFTEEKIIGFLREAENSRPKRLLTDTLLENEVTKEALRKNGERTGTA